MVVRGSKATRSQPIADGVECVPVWQLRGCRGIRHGAEPVMDGGTVNDWDLLGLWLSMTVEAIKDAIAGLSEDDRHSLAAWLNDLSYDAWDRQMVQDFIPGGRGMAWAERVKRQIAEGKARPMERDSQVEGPWR